MIPRFIGETGNLYCNTEWCALFASYCYDLNYAVASYKPINSYKFRVKEFTWLENYRKKSTYVPKPGDLIIFDWPYSIDGENPSNDLPDHVGIVSSYDVNTKRIYTIEGNIGDGDNKYNREVACRSFSFYDSRVIGFYSLNNGF